MDVNRITKGISFWNVLKFLHSFDFMMRKKVHASLCESDRWHQTRKTHRFRDDQRSLQTSSLGKKNRSVLVPSLPSSSDIFTNRPLEVLFLPLSDRIRVKFSSQGKTHFTLKITHGALVIFPTAWPQKRPCLVMWPHRANQRWASLVGGVFPTLWNTMKRFLSKFRQVEHILTFCSKLCQVAEGVKIKPCNQCFYCRIL